MSHLAPDELLLDYAAGTLAEGPALAVALHVALEPAAQRSVRTLGALGGAFLESEVASPVEETALERTLARLDQTAVEPKRPALAAPAGFDWAPPPLRKYLPPGARWRRVFGGFEEIRLGILDGSHRVSLLRLMPGKGLPLHRHSASEYTVVLQGGYTDSTGNYVVGDFAVGPGGEEHQPIADAGEPCIALIVLERPIVLTGPVGRWLNPLVERGWL